MKTQLLLITLMLFLAPFSAVAQERPLTLRLETDLVAIDLIATDKKGEYVRDLQLEELVLIEDGKLRPIDLFSITNESVLSRPIAVVFALDVSGSLKPEETVTLRNAAMKFIDLTKGESLFAVMTFNNEVKIQQGFTSDPQKLAHVFANAVKFGGSTRIYDAIDRAVTFLERQAPRSIRKRSVRRAIVVISDGFDSASVIDRREMVRRALAAGVTVYSITLPSYVLSPTRRGDRVITPLDATRIVHATGGSDFSADAKDFTPVFKALAEEIRASYAISFYSNWRDGKYRTLNIKTTREGVDLRMNRNGYYAVKP